MVLQVYNFLLQNLLNHYGNVVETLLPLSISNAVHCHVDILSHQASCVPSENYIFIAIEFMVVSLDLIR